jgi:pimeloyl-ACP methyl ester carboxylesterase
MNLWAYAPRLMQAILGRAVVPAAQDPDPEKLVALFRKEMARSWDEKDRKAVEDDMDTVVEIFREVYRDGTRGHAEEMRIVTSDWGLKLEEIDCPVIMYYGAKDVNKAPGMGRYMAERLPNAQLTVVEGASHFTMGRECEEEFMAVLLKDR